MNVNSGLSVFILDPEVIALELRCGQLAEFVQIVLDPSSNELCAFLFFARKIIKQLDQPGLRNKTSKFLI